MEKAIKLNIIKRLVEKKDGKTFPKFLTKMNIVVKNEEEKGPQAKWVQVKFNQENVKISSLSSGTIEVEASKLNCPYKYEIKKDENGNDVYPYIYVQDIVNFEKFVREVTQDMFN